MQFSCEIEPFREKAHKRNKKQHEIKRNKFIISAEKRDKLIKHKKNRKERQKAFGLCFEAYQRDKSVFHLSEHYHDRKYRHLKSRKCRYEHVGGYANKDRIVYSEQLEIFKNKSETEAEVRNFLGTSF